MYPATRFFPERGPNNVFAALNSLIADYSNGSVNTAQAVSDTTALGSALNLCPSNG